MTLPARISCLAFVLTTLSACTPSADPGLTELREQLLAATPEDRRAALEADLDALAALERDDALGEAERQALLDLFASAARDGSLDGDECALLSALTRDVVVGAGRLDHGRTSPEAS